MKVAFEKTLALAKVYYNCTNKAYETAKKEGDAHSVMFFKKSIEEVVCSSAPSSSTCHACQSTVSKNKLPDFIEVQ